MNDFELRKCEFINETNKIKSFSLRASALVRYKDKYILVLNEGQMLYKHPGGHVISSESLINALKRELKEEIGLYDLNILEYQPFFDYVLIGSNIMINTYFIIEISEQEYEKVINNSPLPVKLFSKADMNLENTWDSEIRAIEYYELNYRNKQI